MVMVRWWLKHCGESDDNDSHCIMMSGRVYDQIIEKNKIHLLFNEEILGGGDCICYDKKFTIKALQLYQNS